MASLDSQKQAHQPRQGIIRKIFSLISNAMPHHQNKSASETPARSSSSETKAKAPAANRAKKQARVSENRAHAKAKNNSASSKSKAKLASASAPSARRKQKKHAAPPVDRTQHNPKDVIPEQPHDPAHSPGHRRVHIEKELH